MRVREREREIGKGEEERNRKRSGREEVGGTEGEKESARRDIKSVKEDGETCGGR